MPGTTFDPLLTFTFAMLGVSAEAVPEQIVGSACCEEATESVSAPMLTPKCLKQTVTALF